MILSTQFARPSASEANPSIAPIRSTPRFLEAPLEQAFDVGGKGPPRFLMTFSVLLCRFSISLMAWVLMAGRVTSLTQLRPSLTNPRRIPPKTDRCDDFAAPLLESEVIGIPPGCVVFGTSYETVDDDSEVPVDETDGADAPAEPDVVDGPERLPVDPGAAPFPANDVMEMVALLGVACVEERWLPDWDCEAYVFVEFKIGPDAS